MAAQAGSSVGNIMNKGMNWAKKGALVGAGAVAGATGASAYYQAKKEKIEKTPYVRSLTKAGRKRDLRRTAKRRFAGDEGGFNRKKVSEVEKSWKEVGCQHQSKENIWNDKDCLWRS